MSGDDAMKRLWLHVGSGDAYLRELGLAAQKSGQFAKGFREAVVEATAPCQGMACCRWRDLLVPEVQVDDLVTGVAERPIGKHDLVVQSAELSSKNAVRPVVVFEHLLPSPQPTIEGKNGLRPKWPLAANFAPLVHKWGRHPVWRHEKHPRCRPSCGRSTLSPSKETGRINSP